MSKSNTKVLKWTGFCGVEEQAKSISLKNGNKFAFVTLLFPNPNNKQESPYMVGNISTALALKRQGTKADLVCLVTPDVDADTMDALSIVYDHVKIVPYIHPHKSVIQTFRESYLNMFTKLHIFNSDVLPYKKVCFVDSDIIPLRNYDGLFDINTPAGILEPPRDMGGEDYGFKHRCIPQCRHGSKIPKKFTDIWLEDAGDINAGLLLVEPSMKEFNDMMKEIERPAPEWIHKDSPKFRGYYDADTRTVNYFFTWPEQQYLTSRYSGEWHSIGYEFASWCVRPAQMNGVHYVPFDQMPWMDTFSKIKRKENSEEHTECLQLFYIVMYEGFANYPALRKNRRLAKYADHLIKSLPRFAKKEVSDDVILFKKEQNWTQQKK